ncbi:MAG: SIMPL domain-containing protein [Microgenomates group bacterium]|nr:SIMPL domain-containing protein [Microgenomates group bacterium]
MEQKNYFLSLAATLLMVLICLFLIKFFNISYPITIITTTKTSELAVVGEGKIDAVPDLAYVDAGITVNNLPTTDAVQNEINQTNNKIIESMKALGIKKEDIKTSNYSINPNYSYDGGRDKISGYNGNATTTIKIRNIQLVPKVIQAVTAAGANQVRGARFTIDKPEVYREQARDLAIKNAKIQAQQLAKKLGISLGKITNIVESSPTNYNYPVYAAQSMLESKIAGSTPEIEPGTQTYTSVVTLYFEKK